MRRKLLPLIFVLVAFLGCESLRDSESDEPSPILFAVKAGNTAAVEQWLDEHSSRITAIVRTSSDHNPLFYAIWNRYPDIVNEFIQRDIRTDIEIDGLTALEWAISANATEIVEMIMHSRNNTTRSTDGLSLAAVTGNLAILDKLVSSGMPVTGTAGGRALLSATVEKHTNIVQYLLMHNVDLNCADISGVTALHIAARDGLGKIAKMLVNAGADLDRQDEYGWTPLHQGSSQNSTMVVSTLIDAGANVNITDAGGYTPLMIAALRGNTEIVRLLIHSGATLDDSLSNGDTALSLARSNSRSTVVDVIATAQKKSVQGVSPRLKEAN